MSSLFPTHRNYVNQDHNSNASLSADHNHHENGNHMYAQSVPTRSRHVQTKTNYFKNWQLFHYNTLLDAVTWTDLFFNSFLNARIHYTNKIILCLLMFLLHQDIPHTRSASIDILTLLIHLQIKSQTKQPHKFATKQNFHCCSSNSWRYNTGERRSQTSNVVLISILDWYNCSINFSTCILLLEFNQNTKATN
jgi:hypothetical protein